MRRLVALLVAVGLVAAAAAIRSAVDDDGDGGEPRRAEDGPFTVACETELHDYCGALDDVELMNHSSGGTQMFLGLGDIDPDAWVTTSAWLEVARERIPDLLEDAEILASSPVTLAVVPDRASALGALCADEPVLRCVGDHAEEPWGELGGDAQWGALRTGVPDPNDGPGLASAAAVAIAFFGDTDFASNDFGPLEAWLGALTRGSRSGDRDPAGIMATRPGKYSAAVTTTARVEQIRSSRLVDVIDSRPAVDVEVVIVRLSGAPRLPDLEPVREALVADGWVAGSGEPEPLLKPGVMAALLTLWKSVTG